MGDKILVLDFDGVVCDSISECLLSSYNAYQESRLSTKKIQSLSKINSGIKKRFFKLRPYLRGAEDYLLIFLIIKNNIRIQNQESFDRLRELHKNNIPKYKKLLYKERDFLFDRRRRLWLSLNPPFRIRDVIKEKPIRENIYILTTKKRKYVTEILKHYGINFCQENVICSTSSKKLRLFLKLLKKSGVSGKNSFYIDDQIEFLLEAKKYRINVFLAGWGYISEEQKEKAKKNKIPIINIKGFKNILSELVI